MGKVLRPHLTPTPTPTANLNTYRYTHIHPECDAAAATASWAKRDPSYVSAAVAWVGKSFSSGSRRMKLPGERRSAIGEQSVNCAQAVDQLCSDRKQLVPMVESGWSREIARWQRR